MTLAWVLLAACGDAGGAKEGSGPGVGQGGAQDFGQFRAILEQGDIPAPQTLDDVGFFNEHKLELPAPTCGAELCLHAELGVMGNMITGSNCTTVMLGMNTPVDPSQLERPPLDLALVIDTSGSMSGAPIEYVREGLLRMLDDLDPDDRVSLVAFSDEAEILAERLPGDATAELQLAIDSLAARGKTNVYDGLRTGYEIVQAQQEEGRERRVVLLSDGEATAGITSAAKIVAMSAGYNQRGHALTTIGMGEQFDPVLMRELSESGGGAFYFLEDPAAVQEVFEEEVTTFLVPLARELRIDVDIDPGYRLRAVYGTKLFEQDGNSASIEIPSVQIAHRLSVSDDEHGRRGGGGAMVVELIPGSAAQVVEPGVVGRITMSYVRPSDGETVAQELPITTSLAVGETPEEGSFSGAAVEKAFVMLNLFAGFRLASERALWGDDAGALATLLPLGDAVRAWLLDHPDDDIADDLRYLEMFVANLRARGAEDPPPSKNPPEPWPAD
ncbi:MAG: VWA domain-containing protein [Deltaproteobacteria bacterium]|nr:VWA domain-containing protein [Nannocystaceae bacterium]